MVGHAVGDEIERGHQDGHDDDTSKGAHNVHRVIGLVDHEAEAALPEVNLPTTAAALEQGRQDFSAPRMNGNSGCFGKRGSKATSSILFRTRHHVGGGERRLTGSTGRRLFCAPRAYRRGEPRVFAMVKAATPEEDGRRRLCRERKVLIGEWVRQVNRRAAVRTGDIGLRATTPRPTRTVG